MSISRVALAFLLLSALPATSQFTSTKHIYPDPSAAHEDLQTAIARARREHKRILVDFGGDWCGDCHVLDLYFEQPANSGLLAKYFVKVDVNVEHLDANVDLATKFGIPLKRGVPALAILDANGTVLYAQKNVEFEHMGQLQPSALTTFLQRWKAEPPARTR